MPVNSERNTWVMIYDIYNRFSGYILSMSRENSLPSSSVYCYFQLSTSPSLPTVVLRLREQTSTFTQRGVDLTRWTVCARTDAQFCRLIQRSMKSKFYPVQHPWCRKHSPPGNIWLTSDILDSSPILTSHPNFIKNNEIILRTILDWVRDQVRCETWVVFYIG